MALLNVSDDSSAILSEEDLSEDTRLISSNLVSIWCVDAHGTGETAEISWQVNLLKSPAIKVKTH